MSWGAFRVARVALAFAASTALIVACASPAGAAVKVGETFNPDVNWGGSGTIVQSISANNSYVFPSDGVITSWSFQANGGTISPLKLKILRAAGGDNFTTVADTELQTPQPATLNTWPTRISVKAGDLLGEYYSDSFSAVLRSNPGYKSNEISSGPGDPSVDPPPGTTVNYPPSGGDVDGDFQIDGSALLEPDVDRDAFGDETQDKCVGTPGAYNGCPNTLTIDRAKQKGTKAKVKVTTTVPGAGTLKAGSSGDATLASVAAVSLKPVSQTITSTSRQQVMLTLKLTKSARKKLSQKGKLKTKVKVVYTPAGGPAGSATQKVKLKS